MNENEDVNVIEIISELICNAILRKSSAESEQSKAAEATSKVV